MKRQEARRRDETSRDEAVIWAYLESALRMLLEFLAAVVDAFTASLLPTNGADDFVAGFVTNSDTTCCCYCHFVFPIDQSNRATQQGRPIGLTRLYVGSNHLVCSHFQPNVVPDHQAATTTTTVLLTGSTVSVVASFV